ncbi:MAG: hypothetical protein H7Y00_07675 [Fimbriimonadaceae bacterium]|nr:hypothetical protein [Chitinophagales bacterium]
MLKKYLTLRRIFKEHKINSIHVINEQLMIFFYPLLFRKHTVLDIFDSIFFTLNKSGNKLRWLKKIIYTPVDKIIVTDENRKNMMPDFIQRKIIVLQNYPNKFTGSVKKKTEKGKIAILYNGWLGVNRGTDVIEKLLGASPEVYVIMAGWCIDERTKALCKHDRVKYKGIITQEESLEIAAGQADYILCVYSPINENNINASPNKIYDAIQTHTPVIINAEVKISEFVKHENIGFILNQYNFQNGAEIIALLNQMKNMFHFSDELVSLCTWENIENRLVDVHAI